jgi:hypothetical protein
MTARLGNVLYWATCILAVLCLVLGWFLYQGADTTGIENARLEGQSDAQIFQQQRNAIGNYKFDEALKAGYTQTEILNYLVTAKRSRASGLLSWPPVADVYIPVCAALFAWLVGRAARYVLAGR